MAECLTRIPVVTVTDLARSLFLCSVLVSYVHESKRYVPELCGFLQELIRQLAHGPVVAASASSAGSKKGTGPLPVTFPQPLRMWKQVVTEVSASAAGSKRAKKAKLAANGAQLQNGSAASVPKFDLTLLLRPVSSSNNVELNRPATVIALITQGLTLVRTLAQLYEALPSFPEVFQPFVQPLEQLLKDSQSAGASAGAEVVTAVASRCVCAWLAVDLYRVVILYTYALCKCIVML